MNKKYYYKKELKSKKTKSESKKITRYSGIGMLIIGACLLIYYSAPIIIWQLLTAYAFVSVTAPVPPPFIMTPELINEIVTGQKSRLSQVNKNISDENWALEYNFKKSNTPSVSSYKIAIPKLKITDATVSTIDSDLSKHLVQYWGTSIPPAIGNTVIFGHSTYPQLFNTDNYRTIFANAYILKIGDDIFVKIKNKTYTYKIIKTIITDPDDLSVLNSNADGSYLTIITCTPPGTTWKRLIIKAKLIK